MCDLPVLLCRVTLVFCKHHTCRQNFAMLLTDDCLWEAFGIDMSILPSWQARLRTRQGVLELFPAQWGISTINERLMGYRVIDRKIDSRPHNLPWLHFYTLSLKVTSSTLSVEIDVLVRTSISANTELYTI